MIPVCRYKMWRPLIYECDPPLREYVFGEYSPSSDYDHEEQVEKVKSRVMRTFIELNPEYWKPAPEGNYWTFTTKIKGR